MAVQDENKYQDYNSEHFSVMLPEVLQYLSPKDGEVYVDMTFGRGGYSRAILEAADCTVYGIDRDTNVKQYADELTEKFGDKFQFLSGNFSAIKELLAQKGVNKVDGVVFDLGVSSMQLDQAERGFSFMRDGPLDMRMGDQGIDAAYVVNTTEEKELADIIYKYGDERKSRRIAKAIVEARKEQEITTTLELAEIVQKVVRRAKDGINPATRTFQAIRIYINDELGEVERALHQVKDVLDVGGRVVVVSFHSLEDRIVKNYLKEEAGRMPSVSRHVPINHMEVQKSSFKLLSNKTIKPSSDEVRYNVRSRSARMRAAVRLEDIE